MAVTFARGFRAGTAACGIKAFTTGSTAIPTSQRDDLCVIQSEHGCDTGGVFTTNRSSRRRWSSISFTCSTTASAP